jgi:hypothetical protein
MQAQIRELDEAEIDAVSGGANEEIGRQVVEGMWKTIQRVNDSISMPSMQCYPGRGCT